MTPYSDNIPAQLRQAGLVVTRQRAVIFASLAGRTDHPDAERVLVDVRGQLSGISLDTVYRTLSRFADLGLAQHLALPTRRARFDGNTAPTTIFCARNASGSSTSRQDRVRPMTRFVPSRRSV